MCVTDRVVHRRRSGQLPLLVLLGFPGTVAIDDAYFSAPEGRAAYVPFLNAFSERILPGTDFLASRDKDLDVYREELEVTGRIHRHLDDNAFRNIALGESYFRLLDLEYEAPTICSE